MKKTKFDFKIAIILILVIVLIVLLYFYLKSDSQNIEEIEPMESSLFETKSTESTNMSQDTKTDTIQATSEIQSNLTENISLHATYYLAESYVEDKKEVKSGENILKYTNGSYLTAPYDCIIEEIKIPEVNGKCTNEHYIKISSTNILCVQLKVDESKIKNIELGQEAKIEVPALDSKTFDAYITNISNTASNGSFTVVAQFENDGNIKIGMTANISI